MVDKCASSLYRIYLFFYSKIPLNWAAKVQIFFFAPTLFMKKMKKAKPKTILPFFKLLKFNRLCNHFLFGDVLQRLNEEVPERLNALDEQGLVG